MLPSLGTRPSLVAGRPCNEGREVERRRRCVEQCIGCARRHRRLIGSGASLYEPGECAMRIRVSACSSSVVVRPHDLEQPVGIDLDFHPCPLFL